jgi:hypothetical protein
MSSGKLNDILPTSVGSGYFQSWAKAQLINLISPAGLLLSSVIFFIGCTSSLREESQPLPIITEPKINWRQLDTTLPTLAELEDIRTHSAQKLPEVIAGLNAGNASERRRSAYILESLGQVATAAIPSLKNSYYNENDDRNRVYICRALAEIGDGSPENVQFLRAEFGKAKSPILKTYLAGAIVKLNGLKNNENLEAIQTLLDCLNVTDTMTKLSTDSKSMEEFWEQCWAASFMIGKMRKEGMVFIQVLETAIDNENIPEWVMREIWFTLQKLSSAR